MFARSKGPNQLKPNLNQTYDYWSGKHKWQLDRIVQDASLEARIFTDTIQDTRIKLDANLGVEILWKDYCSECSAVSGYGPQCLEVTFKGQDGHIDHIDHVCLVETSNCVYKGSFINEVEATPVVATRGCPGRVSIQGVKSLLGYCVVFPRLGPGETDRWQINFCLCATCQCARCPIS